MMNDSLREIALDHFDRTPAKVATYRNIVRRIIAQLDNYSPLERDIIDWDREGRHAARLDELRKAAWDFTETGESSYRHRLFAGFVTNDNILDGYGADFLFDIALHLGIEADKVFEIVMHRDCTSGSE